jgi:inner membrane transporter RhtA
MARGASVAGVPSAAASPPRGIAPAPALLVLGGVTSVQFGAALAKSLFDDIGVGATVWLRVGLAAVILALAWRPSLRGHTRAEVWLLLLFGVSLAGMNLAFYASIDRIPLGVAVTLEFVGPLGVAVAGSRRALDVAWVVLAAAGIVLLSDLGGADLDALGMGLALLAGAFWAAYILLAARVGRGFPGGGGLALSMVVAGLLLTPLGLAHGGGDLLDPAVVAIGLGVAVLSSVIPYSLELEALRRMPASVFGVLMSLEPGVAALAGFVMLSEGLAAREIVAIAMVVAASAGAALSASPGSGPKIDRV